MKNRPHSSRLHVKNQPVSTLISIFFISLFTISCSDNITPQTIISQSSKPEEQIVIDVMKKEDFISVKPILLNKQSEFITSLKLDTVNIQLLNLSEKIKKDCQGYKLTVFYEDTLQTAFDSETKINENNILPFEMKFIKSGKYFLRLTCFFYNSKIEIEKYTFADIPIFITKNEKEESHIQVFWQKGDIYRNVVWGVGFDEKKKYRLIFSNDFISKSFEIPLTYVAENELTVGSIEKIDPNEYTISLVENNNLIGFQEAILRDDYSQSGVIPFGWWDSKTQKMTSNQVSKIKLGKGEFISSSYYGVDQEYLKLRNIVTNREFVIKTEKIESPTSYLNSYKYVFPDTLEEGKYELVKMNLFNNNGIAEWKSSFPYSRIIEISK
jgi:hypothetical protein